MKVIQSRFVVVEVQILAHGNTEARAGSLENLLFTTRSDLTWFVESSNYFDLAIKAVQSWRPLLQNCTNKFHEGAGAESSSTNEASRSSPIRYCHHA